MNSKDLQSVPSLPRFAVRPKGPQRIVCLTEETTETIYALGEDSRLVGISGFTVRPKRARQEKVRVSAYTSANLDKITALKPDLVFAFSDLQADIVAQLVRLGMDVHVFNHRSVDGIFQMIQTLGYILQVPEKTSILINTLQNTLNKILEQSQRLEHRPRVYFEEWDEPRISAIQWVSELIEVAGGQPCFPELAVQAMGKDRIIPNDQQIIDRDPEIIMGSWCGKKFRPESVMQRTGWEKISAVRQHQLFEIKSPLILQPGPAALTDGLAQMAQIIANYPGRGGSA